MAAVAPMDLVIKADPAPIPLNCALCPKRPNFSDVSHLLTHISSKSHLSHRFKTELRSHTEREAREAIRQYEDWYERYGIRALLAERMAAKDQKMANKRGRTPYPSSRSRSSVPRRSDSVKAEPDDLGASPAATGIPLWSSSSRIAAQFQNTSRDSDRTSFDSPNFPTPTLKRSVTDEYSLPTTPDNMGGNVGRGGKLYACWPSPGEEIIAGVIIRGDNESEIDEAGKLKGVRYPGMGLFDAASELEKRKRNQRKDDSVLKRMAQTSEGIEPTEYVWGPNGELERTRDIFDSPSVEGSPERKLDEDDEEPPKKKRARRQVHAAVPAAKPQQTRLSARIAKKRATKRRIDDEDDDAFFDQQDGNDASQRSGHGQVALESYDVFQDHSKRSRDGSDSPADMTGFDLRRRFALHPMNPNSGVSAESKPAKPQSYFPSRDNIPASFPSAHHPASNNPYFHQHGLGNGIGSGNVNPLYVQTRNGYFHPYSYASYGAEVEAPTPSFQPIDNTTVNPNLTSIAFNPFQTGYHADSSHQRSHNDFEL